MSETISIHWMDWLVDSVVRPRDDGSMPWCPSCHLRVIQRIGGLWCPRCRGWLMQYRKPGDGEVVRYIGATGYYS